MAKVIAFSDQCADNAKKGGSRPGGVMHEKLHLRNQIMSVVLAILMALATACGGGGGGGDSSTPATPTPTPTTVPTADPSATPTTAPTATTTATTTATPTATPTPTPTATATPTPTPTPTTSGTWSLTDYQYLYNYNAVYLSGRTIRYPNIPVRVGSTSVPTSVPTAFNVWNSASGGRLRFTFASGSGTITVTMDNTMSSNICGQCVTWWNSAGEIVQAEITLNPDQSRCSGGLSKTLTHEAGHATGFLGHDSSSIMNPTGSGGVTTQNKRFYQMLYTFKPGTDIRGNLNKKFSSGDDRYDPDGSRVYSITLRTMADLPVNN